MRYTINLRWTASRDVEVEASSWEEAEEIARKTPLKDPDVVEDLTAEWDGEDPE
jgi:hypothetical protein